MAMYVSAWERAPIRVKEWVHQIRLECKAAALDVEVWKQVRCVEMLIRSEFTSSASSKIIHLSGEELQRAIGAAGDEGERLLLPLAVVARITKTKNEALADMCTFSMAVCPAACCTTVNTDTMYDINTTKSRVTMGDRTGTMHPGEIADKRRRGSRHFYKTFLVASPERHIMHEAPYAESGLLVMQDALLLVAENTAAEDDADATDSVNEARAKAQQAHDERDNACTCSFFRSRGGLTVEMGTKFLYRQRQPNTSSTVVANATIELWCVDTTAFGTRPI